MEPYTDGPGRGLEKKSVGEATLATLEATLTTLEVQETLEILGILAVRSGSALRTSPELWGSKLRVLSAVAVLSVDTASTRSISAASTCEIHKSRVY